MGLGNSNEEYGQVRSSGIEQKEYEKELWAKRITEIPSNMHMEVEYTAGIPTYVGFAAKGLATSASGWLIQKFSYDASGNCTKREIAMDCYAWDNRATVTYG